MKKFLLLAILALGIILRLYHLNWGAPYYFHPDERNIASSVAQLNFPGTLNPHFFAYGSLPIYLTYGVGVLVNVFSQSNTPTSLYSVSFEQAILILRVVSALLSIGVLLLFYRLVKRILNETFAIIGTTLVATSVGLIQYAHFGTFEMYLTFFTLLLFDVLLTFIEKKQYRYFILASFITAVLVAIKVSSISLIPLPLFAAIIVDKSKIRNLSRQTALSVRLARLAGHLLVILTITGLVFYVLNPFALLDSQSFHNSMNYESSVALGQTAVFYTGTFIDTTPLWYQVSYVFPFLLNPLIFILFIPMLAVTFLYAFLYKRKNILLLIFFVLFLVIPQAVLYVKWTRYMIPALPFMYLVLLVGIFLVYEKVKLLPRMLEARSAKYIALILMLIIQFLFTFAFVKTVYLSPDTREVAAKYASQFIDNQTLIVADVFDLGILPFNSKFTNLKLFDFYSIDRNPEISATLPSIIQNYEVYVAPSQRILKSRILHPKELPKGYAYYKDLIDGESGQLLYKTPCDVWCRLTYLGDPVFGVEDTANVFDRPTIFIYRLSHEKI